MGKGRVSFVFAVFTLLFVLHGVSLADVVDRTEANSDGNAGKKGDPISTATGELYFSTTDLFLGGPLPLGFSRYYASLLAADGNVISALGNNWMSNFDLRLALDGAEATVVYYRGKAIEFEKVSEDWLLITPEPVAYQLKEFGVEFKLYKLMNPINSLIFTFDSIGRLIRIEDRNGNTLTLTYVAGVLSQVSDGLGRSLDLTYDSGKLIKVQDQSGRYVSYGYAGDDLTEYTDPRGNTTEYSYTTTEGFVGLMTSEKRPKGNAPYTQAYDYAGRVVAQTNSEGNSYALSFNDPSPGRTTVADPLSNTIIHDHLDDKYLISHQDQDSESIYLLHDSDNRRNAVTDRLGDTTSLTYHDDSGKLASHTDALGNTTALTYAAQEQGDFTFYNLTRVDYPDGAFSTRTYDASGNMLSYTDRAGKVWAYTYNSRGQVLTAKNPTDALTIFTYKEDGTLAAVTDHAGNTTRFDHDALKRLEKVTHPDDTSRSYTYDANDNLLSVTDERGKVTTCVYDGNDNLVSITDPLGKTITLGYDGNDRVSKLDDQLSKTTTYAYDELERLKTVTNPAGEILTYGYNAHGWLTSITDPLGKTTGMAYDKEGVVSSLTDPLLHKWNYTTDKLGRITGMSTPLSYNHGYTRDSMGRVTSYTNPLSQAAAYTYNPRGLLTNMSLPEGISASYLRNELGLITQITDPNGNAWKRDYDEMGRLISRTDPLFNETTYDYDSRNRLSRVTFPESHADITRDERGNVTRRLYSDGTDLQYTYDANNRLLTGNDLSLSYDARGDIIESNGLTITRDDVGRIATIVLAPGKEIAYTYNERGLISQVSDWVGGATELDYDDNGRLLTISRPNGVVTIYTYDDDGRLVGVVEEKAGSPETLSSIELTRDGVGNAISAVRDVPLMPDITAQVQAYAYDAASQVEGYTYDAMGRRTEDDTRVYTWDLASRLTSCTEGGNTTTFIYDGLGMRIKRTSGGTAQVYVWNYALGRPSVSVVRQGGSDIRYYVHLPPDGRLLYFIEAEHNTRRYYHFDEMGTTLFLTDEGGSVTDSYGTTPDGSVLVKAGDTENPFTYLGAYGVMQEGDTGLYCTGNRYYDSGTACFISRDSEEFPHPGQISEGRIISYIEDLYLIDSSNPIIPLEGLPHEPKPLTPPFYLDISLLGSANLDLVNGVISFRPVLEPQFGDADNGTIFGVEPVTPPFYLDAIPPGYWPLPRYVSLPLSIDPSGPGLANTTSKGKGDPIELTVAVTDDDPSPPSLWRQPFYLDIFPPGYWALPGYVSLPLPVDLAFADADGWLYTKLALDGEAGPDIDNNVGNPEFLTRPAAPLCGFDLFPSPSSNREAYRKFVGLRLFQIGIR